MEVPTMEINVDGHPVVINVSDFDPNTMTRYDDSQEKKEPEPKPETAANPLEVSFTTPPPVSPAGAVEDVAESARRRSGRG